MTDKGRNTTMAPPELLTALRSEIVHAQQMAADLLKWKLFGAATVASLALGFGGPSALTTPDASLLICLIPLICTYVDMASLDLVIRVIVIARFLCISGDSYETFVYKLRTSSLNPFLYAPAAVHLSSAVMNAVIVAVGIYGLAIGWVGFRAGAYLMMGLLGLVATFILWKTHRRKITNISDYDPQNDAPKVALI